MQCRRKSKGVADETQFGAQGAVDVVALGVVMDPAGTFPKEERSVNGGVAKDRGGA